MISDSDKSTWIWTYNHSTTRRVRSSENAWVLPLLCLVNMLGLSTGIMFRLYNEHNDLFRKFNINYTNNDTRPTSSAVPRIRSNQSLPIAQRCHPTLFPHPPFLVFHSQYTPQSTPQTRRYELLREPLASPRSSTTYPHPPPKKTQRRR